MLVPACPWQWAGISRGEAPCLAYLGSPRWTPCADRRGAFRQRNDMRDSLLMGIGRHMIPVPRFIWRRQVSRGARRLKESLSFMSGDHHRIRYFLVRELPRRAAPISPEYLSQHLGMPSARVNSVLKDLEKHLTFLFRNSQGAVTWAYPVTADLTPHHVVFSTGEQIYAA